MISIENFKALTERGDKVFSPLEDYCLILVAGMAIVLTAGGGHGANRDRVLENSLSVEIETRISGFQDILGSNDNLEAEPGVSRTADIQLTDGSTCEIVYTTERGDGVTKQFFDYVATIDTGECS